MLAVMYKRGRESLEDDQDQDDLHLPSLRIVTIWLWMVEKSLRIASTEGYCHEIVKSFLRNDLGMTKVSWTLGSKGSDSWSETFQVSIYVV